METSLTYNDVLIKPKFSFIRSRKFVELDSIFMNRHLKIPIISANMDCITEFKMSSRLSELGVDSALHRFCTIEENIKMFLDCSDKQVVISIGVGANEFERALALHNVGAHRFLIDVAHGASIQVVEQYDRLRERLGTSVQIAVGNFDNNESIQDFLFYSISKIKPDAIKVGVGTGSHCTTRIVSGCGGGAISAIRDCSLSGIPIIADGGIREPGDVAKAIAAGASIVMLGNMFAGTEETPGDTIGEKLMFKGYRGSASYESYSSQGKHSEWRTPEGESSLVSYKGPVENVVQRIEAGLRSALSYTGSQNLFEFRNNAQLVRTTGATIIENGAHGKLQRNE